MSAEGSRLVDISSGEDMAGLSEADMIPDLHNTEDPIEVNLFFNILPILNIIII